MATYRDQVGYGCCGFFMSWVVLGNFVCLSLFLAVVMETFESKYDVQASARANL